LTLALAVAVGWAISTLVRYDVLRVDHLPRVAVSPVFALVLANALLFRVLGRRLLGARRLMYVYVAVLATANIMGVELVIRQYPIMIAAQGYATPGNKVGEVVLPHVPEWMVPAVAPDAPAVRYAFEGGADRGRCPLAGLGAAAYGVDPAVHRPADDADDAARLPPAAMGGSEAAAVSPRPDPD
jgi:hypothetical protein